MAGIPIPFGDIIHQYSGPGLHRRILAKRQGRDPLESNPGANPGASSTDDGAGSLSLGRPSATPGPGDDGDDDADTTTSEPTTSRTRTTTSETTTSTTSTTEEPDTSTTETTTSTSETSSFVPVITTTIESTSTSTSFSLPDTTTEAETTLPDTTSLPTTTSPTTRALITSIVTASASLSRSTASNSLASSGASSDSSGGPSAGTVVGIVAGALVGVVVLSGIVGYFFRTKCSNKNDQDDFDGENPFGNMDDGFGGATSRSEMRRDSQMLADESDSIHQMSELGHGNPGSYGNAAPIAMGAGAAAAGAYALNRGNSTNENHSLPGLQRNDTMNPRPPTMIQRHYAAQQQGVPPMPSFQPGQIVYPSAQSNQNGPYPNFASGGVPVGAVFPSSSSSNGHHDLNRNPTYRDQQQYPSNAGDDYYQQQQDNGYDSQQQMPPQRSGTPEHANPQQYFHQASDSFGSGIGNPSPFEDIHASPARGNNGNNAQAFNTNNNNFHVGAGYDYQAGQGYEQLRAPSNAAPMLYPQQGTREGAMKGSDRAKRTLSVRNGGAVDDDGPRDSVYGGM